MTGLQKDFISFIPSQTMRKHLAENIETGNWIPSAEDMAATVLQSGKNIFKKSEFLKALINETLSESTRKQLENIIAIHEKVRDYISCSRYAFECEDRYCDKVHVFNSVRRMIKFLRKQNGFYFRVIDKQKSGFNRYVAELMVENDEIVEADSIADGSIVHNTICSRYVKFPVPFEAGDTVYCTGNKNELFCVINADQPDSDMLYLDSVDASIMIIPYEYREYATPEKIHEHYENIKKGAADNKQYTPDIISIQHGHLAIIYAELYEKYNKGE